MILRRKENILIEDFDEQIVVFDLDRNLPFVLNGVAGCILMHTDGVSDQETIARRVCEEFDVGFPQALEDIRGLHEEFLARKIVRPVA